MNRSKEKHSMSRMWLAAATAGALALGVSACGSSNGNTTAATTTGGGSTSASSSVNATLNGKTIADIFLGEVKKWNDPEIAGLNPGMSLPSSTITVIHRSDESGTTKGFTSFLQDYSPEWKSKVGSDKTVKWPTGTGAKGNDGVAAAIKQTDGTIGYVEQAYALQNNFTFASVKNKSGSYVAPTLASTTA